MWFGKKHTIIHTLSGPMLQIDRACKVMLAPVDLVKFVAKMCRKDERSVTLADCATANRQISKGTKLWKIASKHTRRPYKLRGLDDRAADKAMFELENGTMTSVADYFRDKFPQFPLSRPDLPCVMVGRASNPKAILVPMELCSFVSCQPAPVTSDVQAEQIKLTSEPPKGRFDRITAIHKDLLEDERNDPAKTLASFGMRIGSDLVKASAVVMESPKLCYADAHGKPCTVPVKANDGSWQVRAGPNDLQFIDPGSCRGFAVANFERSARDIEGFVRELANMARLRGMDIGGQIGRVLDGTGKRYGKDVEDFLESQVKMLGSRVELVICIIGNKDAENARELYPAIKRWSHVKSGIPTQCVQAFKATQKMVRDKNYHAGVLLKLNLKLGGANVVADGAKGGLALLRSEPTMVMGFDVNHPQPGSSKPSFSALVAALDQECTKYYTAIGSQPSRTEVLDEAQGGGLIKGFVEKVRACLRAFHEARGVPPKRILFYRDGVAHNQFDAVKQNEIAQIFDACRLEGGEAYQPKLTFLIVQQRNRARFATVDYKNVPAGTVIHKDVVSGDGLEWYMVAQCGRLGTSRPTHFHIIHDDVEITDPSVGGDPKLLHRLTFDLCHLYARATKIVSRPAPVYYAHRAAFLAQYYKASAADASPIASPKP